MYKSVTLSRRGRAGTRLISRLIVALEIRPLLARPASWSMYILYISTYYAYLLGYEARLIRATASNSPLDDSTILPRKRSGRINHICIHWMRIARRVSLSARTRETFALSRTFVFRVFHLRIDISAATLSPARRKCSARPKRSPPKFRRGPEIPRETTSRVVSRAIYISGASTNAVVASTWGRPCLRLSSNKNKHNYTPSQQLIVTYRAVFSQRKRVSIVAIDRPENSHQDRMIRVDPSSTFKCLVRRTLTAILALLKVTEFPTYLTGKRAKRRYVFNVRPPTRMPGRLIYACMMNESQDHVSPRISSCEWSSKWISRFNWRENKFPDFSIDRFGQIAAKKETVDTNANIARGVVIRELTSLTARSFIRLFSTEQLTDGNASFTRNKMLLLSAWSRRIKNGFSSIVVELLPPEVRCNK